MECRLAGENAEKRGFVERGDDDSPRLSERQRSDYLARQHRAYGNAQRRYIHLGANAAHLRAAFVVWRVDTVPKVIFASADLEIIIILPDICIKISPPRIGIQQRLVCRERNVEISIHSAVDEFHFQDMLFRIITDRYQAG